jgi:hypothetical protein
MKRINRDTPVTITLKAETWVIVHRFIALCHKFGAGFITKETNDAVVEFGCEMEAALQEAEFMLQDKKSSDIN